MKVKRLGFPILKMFHNPSGVEPASWAGGTTQRCLTSMGLTDLDPHGAPFGMAKKLAKPPFVFAGFQDFTNGIRNISDVLNEVPVEFFLFFFGMC